MTFRGKLQMEHPEKIDKQSFGGCMECPKTYGYEKKAPEFCNASKETCTKCWNREMPKTELLTEKEKMIDAMSENAYNQGANDVWVFVEKCSCLTKEKRLEIFGTDSLCCIFRGMSYQEALAKLKAYEDSKIEVGDVVIDLDGKERVVLFVDFKGLAQIYGSHGVTNINKENLKKTGKHIDIKLILEQIGE